MAIQKKAGWQGAQRRSVNTAIFPIGVVIRYSVTDDSILDNTYLNGSNRHLNSNRSAFLAFYFIKYLRKEHHRRLRNRSKKDFRMAVINQVGDMLKAILSGNSQTILR